MKRLLLKFSLSPLLFMALSVFPESVMAGDAFVNAALQRHEEKGRLDREVRDRIAAKGESELLVLLADDAGSLSQSPDSKQKESRSARLDRRARLIAEKKKALIARTFRKFIPELTTYSQFPIMHLKLNGQDLADLLDQPEVVSVRENRRVTHFLTESLPLIHAPQVQAAGMTGSGSAVAVLDTGVDYTRSAFGSCTTPGQPSTCKVIYSYDFTFDAQGNHIDDGSLDDNGHGTNVAGIVAGVAPDVKIIALDVFRPDGYGYYSDLLAALDWVALNSNYYDADSDTHYNIASVNMSLGGGAYSAPCPSDPLAGAIATLRNEGILSAIASGNSAYSGYISSPACAPGAISVGAVYDSNLGTRYWTGCTDLTTAADQVTCFTNMAGFMSVLAPGALVSAAGSTYGGTSQATPHVAGAIAVIKAAHPGFDPDTIESRLITTGDSVTTARGSYTYTKPRINLQSALDFPKIGVSPTSIDFGAAAPGRTSQPQTIEVDNGGSVQLVLGTLSVSGANPEEFSIRTNGCSAATLSPGSSCTASLDFRPATNGSKSATLLIESNDPDNAQKTVTLSGTASGFQLSVTKSGNGSVTSQPDGIDCGSTCSVQFIPGVAVGLIAVPAADSLFSGWNGGCSGTGYCTVTMSADIPVNAAFILKPPVMLQMLPPAFNYTLSGIYNAAGDDSLIALQAVSLAEEVIFNRNISVTVNGGFDGAYSRVVGMTTINGALTIGSGSATIANIIIR